MPPPAARSPHTAIVEGGCWHHGQQRILLVQVIKARAAEGMDLARAAGQASRECFRPILMSVSTTMMGLVPLLMETSIQAQTTAVGGGD